MDEHLKMFIGFCILVTILFGIGHWGLSGIEKEKVETREAEDARRRESAERSRAGYNSYGSSRSAGWQSSPATVAASGTTPGPATPAEFKVTPPADNPVIPAPQDQANPGNSVGAVPAADAKPIASGPKPTPPGELKKLPIRKNIKDIYGSAFAKAQTPDEKSSLAKVMVEDAANCKNLDERYVMLETAMRIARDIEDRETEIQCVNAMLEYDADLEIRTRKFQLTNAQAKEDADLKKEEESANDATAKRIGRLETQRLALFTTMGLPVSPKGTFTTNGYVYGTKRQDDESRNDYCQRLDTEVKALIAALSVMKRNISLQRMANKEAAASVAFQNTWAEMLKRSTQRLPGAK